MTSEETARQRAIYLSLYALNYGLLKILNKTTLFSESGGVSGGELPKKAAEENVLL